MYFVVSHHCLYALALPALIIVEIAVDVQGLPSALHDVCCVLAMHVLDSGTGSEGDNCLI